MCEQVNVEPLPDYEAREQLQRFAGLLEPAFAAEFRLH
jgi:hypothetical protein